MTEKEAIRQEIDALDQELLTLLNRRQTLAQTIGRIKNREGRGTLDFQREEEVLAHLMHLNPGPLSQAALRNIFREIISAAREVQIPFGVAFLGPEATFSHLAALKKFGRATRYGPMTTIQEVFSRGGKGQVPVRGGAHRKLHRGHRQRLPGPVRRDLREDLRRDLSGGLPRPGEQVRTAGRYRGDLYPPPALCPVPRLAGDPSARDPHP